MKMISNRFTDVIAQKSMWLKQISAMSFVFFFLKGVLWLILPLLWFASH